MKKTKENLIIELTKIGQSHEEGVTNDLRIRKEFARAFRWNKPKRQFDYGDAELYEPTWIEIFVKLGKLLAAKNFMDFEVDISELECKIQDLENKIKNARS